MLNKIKIMSYSIFLVGLISYMSFANAQNMPGQTLQINTHFHRIEGKPSWLLILRDVETGQILPYLFDLHHNDNFWVAFTFGHSYRVTASNLQFNAQTTISNFCHLEEGVLSGKSQYITLTGTLTPNPASTRCHVLKYQDMPFSVN